MEQLKLLFTLSAFLFVAFMANGQEEKDNSWKMLKANDSLQSIHSQKQLLRVEHRSDSVRNPGLITIHQNEKIDELILIFNDADIPLDGYRIQIFLGKPKEAQKVRTKFVAKYPDIPAYDPWQTPNMKIRIGDFPSKLDAERALKVIRKDYPGAYIVQDNIELPDLDTPLFESEDQ